MVNRKAIEAGGYDVSIQASEYHYCTPRKTLPNIEDYKEVEIAIFKDGEFVNPRGDGHIMKFKKYDSLIERYENGVNPVCGYLDINIALELVEFLSKA